MSNQSTKRLYLIGAIILLSALGFGMIMVALNNALFFDGYAEDGAFQLLNPLRRIVEGEVIGRDFSFFHGIGVPLIHLPVYLFFGQGVFGDEMARWLVSPLLWAAVTLCVFYVWRRSWTFALAMTGVVTAVALIVIPFMVLPITSILGVRSAVPVFLLAVVLNQRRLTRKVIGRGHWFVREWTWYELFVALLLAASVVCGTEFGAAALLAFGIAHVLYRTNEKQPLRERVWSGLRVLGGFIVALIGMLSILTHGHPLTPLKYALVDIPADQFWYFGAPPNSFLHMENLFTELFRDGMFVVLVLVGLLAAGLMLKLHRLKKYRVEMQAFLYAWLAGIFGCVSMLGYFNIPQLGAWGRMSIIISAISIYILVSTRRRPITFGAEIGRFKSRVRLQGDGLHRAIAGLFIVLSLAAAVAVFVLVKAEYDIFKTLRRAGDYVSGVDTNVLSPRWRDISETIIPTVQADNYVAIVDFNGVGFTHGIKSDTVQLVVESGDKAPFLRHGQVVYLHKAGRQIIAEAVKLDDERMLITLQNKKLKLDPELDGTYGKMIVAEDFTHDDNKLWSSYTGAINQEMGLLHPSRDGYDYIIHALGKQRRQDYLNDFIDIKPKFVTTFTHAYSGWEGWLQDGHWDMYSLLDKNYEVVEETAIYALWQRKDQPWESDGYKGANWQKLNLEGDKIKLAKPSFDGVPDIEAYGQQLARLQRDRLLMMGRPVDKHPQLPQDEFDKYWLEKTHDERKRQAYQKDNNGKQTDQKIKEQDDLKRTEKSDDSPNLHTLRPKRQVILVRLQYELQYSPKVLSPTSRFMRYVIEMEGVYSKTTVTLRPYADEVVFPIVISELNDDPYLKLKAKSLFPGSGEAVIKHAEWTVLNTSDANLKVLTD